MGRSGDQAFADLGPEDQAKVIDPEHGFPLLAMGRTADTSELVMSIRLYGAKDVHRVPYSAGIVSSPSTWWPMFLGTLPPTTMAIMRTSMPAVHIGDRDGWFQWVTGQWSGWGEDGRHLWQAGVAGHVLDQALATTMLTMPLDQFVQMVNTLEVPGPHPLRIPLLLFALYRQWAQAKDLLPVMELALGEDGKVLGRCPVTPQGWGKLIPAAQKTWRYTVGSALHGGGQQIPAASWKRHLRPQDEPVGSDGEEKVERLNELVEGVQFFEDSIVSGAVKALGEVLQQAGIESKMLRGLVHCRTAVSLHSAVRLIVHKNRAHILAHLGVMEDWAAACSGQTTQGLTLADKKGFCQAVDAFLGEVETPDWPNLGAVLMFSDTDLPDQVNELAEIRDKASFRRFIACVAKFAQSKAVFRTLLKELRAELPVTKQQAVEEDSFFDEYARESPKKRKLEKSGPEQPMVTSQQVTRPDLQPANQQVVSQGSSVPEQPARAAVPRDGEVEGTGLAGYEVVPTAQGGSNGTTIRINGLTTEYPASRYRRAIQDIFGVTASLETQHLERGWFTLKVPPETVQKVFGSEYAVTIKNPDGFVLRARSRAVDGSEYREWLPAWMMAKGGKGSQGKGHDDGAWSTGGAGSAAYGGGSTRGTGGQAAASQGSVGGTWGEGFSAGGGGGGQGSWGQQSASGQGWQAYQGGQPAWAYGSMYGGQSGVPIMPPPPPPAFPLALPRPPPQPAHWMPEKAAESPVYTATGSPGPQSGAGSGQGWA